jgi:hydroxymethylpyrimidine pyrophosphatase-like HAD family hydrolase
MQLSIPDGATVHSGAIFRVHCEGVGTTMLRFNQAHRRRPIRRLEQHGALLAFVDRLCVEIAAVGVTKAHGLAALKTHLGVPRNRTAAIGDGLNDLALFAAVEYPIAMGQASDRVKRVARWITSSNTEDGVARALGCLRLGASAAERP